MITLTKLCEVLDGLGIEWANEKFEPKEPEPPFIVLVAGYGEAAGADNVTWCEWMPYDVALYTKRRDYKTERKVAEALTSVECRYTKTVTILDSENLTEAAFSVNVTEE